MRSEEAFHAANYELICVIVNFGLGSRILHSAKHSGITGGTILLGKGTVNNHILEFLGLADVRKEIVLMVTVRQTAEEILIKLNEEYKFAKPNHGIAFTGYVSELIGHREHVYYEGTETNEAANEKKTANELNTTNDISNERRVADTMYQAITVVVEKGKAEDVISAATKAGSKGGTIINGRGSGPHEISKVFAMDIEPEKEIVLILAKNTTTEAIVTSIREQLKIDEPGKGIIFVQDVNSTYGLYE